MKFDSVVPIMLILALMASCSGGINDLDRNGLKGKVKETREFQCNPTYENQQWVASENCVEGYRVVEYDNKGFYKQAFSLSTEGDTTTLSTAKRENGDVVEEAFYTRMYMTPKHSKMVLNTLTKMERISDKQVDFEVWQNEQLRYSGSTYYDSKGRIDRQVQLVNNQEMTIHHSYDKNLLVEIFQEDPGGLHSARQLYEYSEFDKKGNWTLRLVYNGDEKIKPEMAITREIEYY
jgi:hypothetical protein